MINTFQGGEATFACTKGALTRIVCIAAPAEMLAAELVPNTAAVGKEHAKARSLSCDCGLPKTEQENAREEPAWSAEAMQSCWTTGWKRLEVTGAIEEALEENKAKFDHLEETEKTADAIIDFFRKAVTNAAR